MTNKIGHAEVPKDKRDPFPPQKSNTERIEESVKQLSEELNRYHKAKVEYFELINAVIINEDSIQIFADIVHINSSYDYFKLTPKALRLIQEIQRRL